MITFEQALQRIESSAKPLATENVTLLGSLNRVLAEEVSSDADMPPFNKAAMDGYACRKADLMNELQVIEDIPAGKVPQLTIGMNQCASIMTGAMVPQGADHILMKEHAERTGENKVICTKANENENICYQGEDLKKGGLILGRGLRLLAPHLALLAASGHTRPLVYELPDVAVISTGNELVEPGQKPDAGKIRNSNGLQLTAQTLQYGLSPDYLGIVPDDQQALLGILAGAVEKYHVVLISGGVSVGDYDFVPQILERLKVDILFHGMQVKPGKHLLLGKKDGHFVVGMPGNPVSSFVQFEVLVKPLLNRLMGLTKTPGKMLVPLEERYVRKKQDTLFFIPVMLTGNGTALPVAYHGSAHIHAYTMANGIMDVPVGVNEIIKGGMVHVRPL